MLWFALLFVCLTLSAVSVTYCSVMDVVWRLLDCFLGVLEARWAPLKCYLVLILLTYAVPCNHAFGKDQLDFEWNTEFPFEIWLTWNPRFVASWKRATQFAAAVVTAVVLRGWFWNQEKEWFRIIQLIFRMARTHTTHAHYNSPVRSWC